jgi:hypothetical protein
MSEVRKAVRYRTIGLLLTVSYFKDLNGSNPAKFLFFFGLESSVLIGHARRENGDRKN